MLARYMFFCDARANFDARRSGEDADTAAANAAISRAVRRLVAIAILSLVSSTFQYETSELGVQREDGRPWRLHSAEELIEYLLETLGPDLLRAAYMHWD